MWCCIPHPHYHASASPASKSTWRVFLDLVSSTNPLPTDQQRRTRQQHTALEFIPSESKTQVTINTPLSHSRSPHSCAHIAQVKVNGRHAPTSRYYFKTIQHTSPFRSTRSQTPKPRNKMHIHASIGFGIIFSVSSLSFRSETILRREDILTPYTIRLSSPAWSLPSPPCWSACATWSMRGGRRSSEMM